MMISNIDFQDNLVQTTSILGGSAFDLLQGPDTDRSDSTEVNGVTVSRIRFLTEGFASGLLSAKSDLVVSNFGTGMGFVNGSTVFSSVATTPDSGV